MVTPLDIYPCIETNRPLVLLSLVYSRPEPAWPRQWGLAEPAQPQRRSEASGLEQGKLSVT